MTASKWALIGVAGVVALGALYFHFRNRPPVALADKETAAAGSPTQIRPLANDSDPDGDPISLVSVDNPGHGTAKMEPDGTVEYRSDPLFFGTDTFRYTITDNRGATAESTIEVSVKLVPPRFAAREGRISLSEMLQQPPTNIYGSSINIYAYQDEDGEIREISITGHADSKTCGQISGLTAGTLLAKRAGSDEFLLAGSGRLSAPVEAEAAVDENDPAVTEYIALKLKLLRLELIEAKDDDDNSQTKSTRAQLNEQLRNSEANSKVVAFVKAQSASILGSFVREAQRIEQSSGLVRIHRLPASLPATVRERLAKSALAQNRSIVRFDDLLGRKPAPAPTEAAVFVSILQLSDGKPLVIDVPLGEFSIGGFSEAVKEHRNALEVVAVGNARTRLSFASGKITENQRQQKACAKLTVDQRKQAIDLDQTCTADGCYRSKTPVRMTWGEYCDTRLQENAAILVSWRAEAQDVLSKIDDDRNSQGGHLVDAFSHASLVDAMLRDWALPVAESQAAFDHWRIARRSAIWASITRELDRRSIDRRVLAGENVVFPIAIEGDRLRIFPTMVLDLQRSAVLVDPRIGATAVLDTWAARESEPGSDPSASQTVNLELMGQSPAIIETSLRVQPQSTARQLLDAWASEFPASKDDFEKRAQRGRLLAAVRSAAGIAKQIDAFDEKFLQTKDGMKYLNVLAYVAESPIVTVETKLRAVLKLANSIAASNKAAGAQNLTTAWDILNSVQEGKGVAGSPGAQRLEKSLGGGIDIDRALEVFLSAAREADPQFFATALAQRSMPTEPSAREKKYREVEVNPVSAPDFEVAETSRIRLRLLQVNRLDRALRAVDSDPVKMKSVASALFDAAGLDADDDESDLIKGLAEEAREESDTPIKTGAISRLQWAGRLNNLSTRLLSEASAVEREIAPYRYSRLHELLATRLAIENGEYAGALDRQFTNSVPLSLYHPKLVTEVLPGDFRGALRALQVREQDGALLISAEHDHKRDDILRLRGLPAEVVPPLVRAIGSTRSGAWSDGEMASDQVLMMVLPARPILANASARLSHEELRLAMLKAVVYGCVAATADEVPLSGRCGEISETEARHDRAVGGIVTFRTPRLEDAEKMAVARFAPFDQ